jgi:HAD superfamily hydrolase (TIGR01509 family)
MNNNLAVIWDMDGTLIDAAELHCKAWQVVLKDYVPQYGWDDFMHGYGKTNAENLQELLDNPSPELIESLGQQEFQWFKDHLDGNLKVLPGVVRWLTQFHSQGAPQAIATSSPYKIADVATRAAGIYPFFDRIVSAHQLPSKPDPSVFLQAASELNAKPAHCLVFEDSPYGGEAARRAGMKCIAVQTSGRTPQELAGADLVVENLEKLDKALLEQVCCH